MARYDFDRRLYQPIWRMLRYLLVMYSMTTPTSQDRDRDGR